MTKTAFHLQTNEDSHNEHMLEMEKETIKILFKISPYSFRSCNLKFYIKKKKSLHVTRLRNYFKEENFKV